MTRFFIPRDLGSGHLLLSSSDSDLWRSLERATAMHALLISEKANLSEV